MVSIYLDWNVISQMKNGSHNSLAEILSQKGRFLIPYSTSHIGDLLSGYKDEPEQVDIINEDLDYLSDLTDNACLINNYEIVRIAYQNPKELFAQRVEERDLIKNLSIEKLFESLAENSETRVIGDLIVKLFKATTIDLSLIKALNDPNNAEQLNRLLPNLKDNPTLEGLFNSIVEMFTRMNESDDYKGLRQSTQTGLGINRDRMYNSEDPYKMIDGLYKKLGISYNQLPKADKYAPAWFNEISSEYILLDMHGFQEDKVNIGKGRKETFRNTTEDAFHAAFASTCNFYIINDNKSYKKTKEVYGRLAIQTYVFKPNEFLQFYENHLKPRTFEKELYLPIHLLEVEPDKVREVNNGMLKTYYVPFFLFDFFNEMHAFFTLEGRAKMIILTQANPSNKDITYFFEIEKLSEKLYQALGNDKDKLGEINLEELEEDDWNGREWEFDSLSFRLRRINGSYQFYYDLKS